MMVDRLEMNGPAACAFGMLLAAMVLVLVGDAVQRVIDCRRRWAQRERELAVLERYHGQGHHRPSTAPGH